MNVVYAERAKTDIATIYDRIAQLNPAALKI